MKIYVNRVPDEGLRDSATYDSSTMDMERFDVRLPDPFTVDAFVTLADQELVVAAAIQCPLRMTCARCLEEFNRTLTTDAVFTYHVQPTGVVDISDDVRQEVILGYPMVPVCQPGCKGLCSVCGQNLNAASCPHQAAERSGPGDRPSGSIAL